MRIRLFVILIPLITAFAHVAVAQEVAPTRAAVIKVAREIIKAARYTTLVTIAEDGRPQARVVDPFAPDSAFTIWVGTNPLTRKVSDIKRDARVTLVYFNASASEYVAVLGTASVVTDSAARSRYWKQDWAEFYKGGPLGNEYVLIRVRPTRLEVVSPGRGILNDPKTWRPVTVDLP